ncbi:hypothetical protein BJ165DRAFT_1492188 [Panaeolus papilionaceus]|nr:hypothetical protein BJ165DRAFT_1492188 [Panaeolus papilionaceus]
MASFGILNLPYELIEYILQSRVSGDSKGDSRDKETERFLGACRLTCRVLHCIAAPMLFQNLQLGSVSDWHDPGTLDRVHAFHNLLRENQKISTYIQSCSIITNDCHTFFQSPDIAVILSQLRQLRHFSLRVYAIRPKLWWSHVTESQAAAFKGICSLPSLTSLEFRGIHDLPLLQLLEHSTNLGELTLRHIYLDLDAYGSCPPTFKLQSLRLINVKTPTSRFQSFKLHEIPAFRSLERLQIYFSSRESIEQARMILEVTQQKIRELHFLPWHTIDSDGNWKGKLRL